MRRLPFVCISILITFTLTNCKKHDDTPVHVIPIPVEFTVATEDIRVNPNGYTPLSAQIAFFSVKEGKTFIRIHGKHSAFSDVTHLFNDDGYYHLIPVIGMYADTVNTVDIRIVDNAGDTVAQSSVAITTQALPTNLPTSITSLPFDESKVEPGMYLVSNLTNYNIGKPPTQPTIPYILDDYGDIRWVLDYSSSSEMATLFYNDGIARLKNGNFYFGNESTQTIYEVDVLGKIINRWPLTGGYIYHHEVHEETNGNFIMTAAKTGSTFTDGTPSVADYVVEIDRTTKVISNIWDMKESLNEYRHVWAISGNADWFHGNAVFDDSTDNTIVVSGRTQGVVKLDRSNNVKWILAPHKDWGFNRRGDTLSKYLLTPLDASGKVITDTTVAYGSTITPDFEWNCYEHSPIQLPNGDLMMFDNGTNRTLDPVDGGNPANGAPGKYSRAAEYKIDEKNMTVQQIWEYGKERDVDCYSSIVSSVQFLPGTNHVVFSPGYNVLNATGHGGKIVEVDYATKQVVNEISITAANNFSHHRAKKISIYPDNL